jgi:hydroxymethylbilane synthase
VRIGTRGSALARWQTDYVAALLQQAWPNLHIETIVFETQGDRSLDAPLPLIGGKGLFTAALEAALREGVIDLAVHSLKDLPTSLAEGLTIGAIPVRGDAHDVFIGRSARNLEELPAGATLGTSSLRRAAQIRRHFPHLRVLDMRGNVDTRIRKALDPQGAYDGILLAQAGVDRLGRSQAICQTLSYDIMLPAPGQGALAAQCRADDDLLTLLDPIDHGPTRAAVTCERAFLSSLGGGCSAPIAAYAEVVNGRVHCRARVVTLDGAAEVEVSLDGLPDAAFQLGVDLAHMALARGAARLMEEHS